jgi:hypothetical protein
VHEESVILQAQDQSVGGRPGQRRRVDDVRERSGAGLHRTEDRNAPVEDTDAAPGQPPAELFGLGRTTGSDTRSIPHAPLVPDPVRAGVAASRRRPGAATSCRCPRVALTRCYHRCSNIRN